MSLAPDTLGGEATVEQICELITRRIGKITASSVRFSLASNVPELFESVGQGRYRLRIDHLGDDGPSTSDSAITVGQAKLYQANCFDWLAARASASIEAVVTDPPYGLVEYTEKEQAKLRNGKGGFWRIPPSFDGHRRAPLPRFTVLDEEDRETLYVFFKRFAGLLARVTVAGANILVASNPLLSHIVASAMSEAGLELRGTIVRLVMTMRGGDRPKNAHREFQDVSVMPRSMWEPWVVLRRPLEGRVQDNLRRWKTGGFGRPSKDRPFGDVIKSNPTPRIERKIAPHPSLKPQGFLRQIVRAALPLGQGVILDPFAGSGSTLAAANAVGYESIGLELDARYVNIARKAIPKLGSLGIEQVDPVGAELENAFSIQSRRSCT
jgi:DNA modification methylase